MKPFELPLQMTRFSCGFFWGNVLCVGTAEFVAPMRRRGFYWP